MLKAFELTLKIGKIPVFSLPHIEQGILSKVQKCKKFKDWTDKLNNLQKGVEVSKIQILGVEMFGENVGFVNMRAVTMKDGFKLPSYIFIRGHAVGILMFVNNKLLLVEQYRVPVQETLLEVPAGMIDQSGDFVGVAAKEIEEETGIKIKNQDLKLLGSFYPSPGACEEELYIYLCQIKRSEEQLKAIQDKMHGDSEHERIRIRLVDYSPELILKAKDSKLLYGAYAYETMVKGKGSPSL